MCTNIDRHMYTYNQIVLLRQSLKWYLHHLSRVSCKQAKTRVLTEIGESKDDYSHANNIASIRLEVVSKRSETRPIHNEVLKRPGSPVLQACQTPSAIQTVQTFSSEYPPSDASGHCSRTCRLDPGDEFTVNNPTNVDENDEHAFGSVSPSSPVEMLVPSTAKTVVWSRT